MDAQTHHKRPGAAVMRRLRTAGLRPTRQRLALGGLLFDNGHRHVTAEELFQEARDAGFQISLATVYNTLGQFSQAGLMSEVVVGSGQSYYDTNAHSHYHYFDKATGEIVDIPEADVEGAIDFSKLPPPPEGKVIERVDLVVRMRDKRRD